MASIDNQLNLIIQNTTNSTSSTTGALQVRGGVGISRNLNVGNTITSSQPCIQLTSTGTLQNVPSGSTTTIDSTGFGTPSVASFGINPPTFVNGTITIRETGFYLISGFFEFEANTTGDREVALFVNGTVRYDYNGQGTSLTFTTMPVQIGLRCTNNDVITFEAWQNSGIALNVTIGSNYIFSVTKLH